MRKAKKDFINIGYWICMNILFIGTNCCGRGNELANHFCQNSPNKIYLHRNPLTFFLVHAFSMAQQRDLVFICPLILQHLHQP